MLRPAALSVLLVASALVLAGCPDQRLPLKPSFVQRADRLRASSGEPDQPPVVNNDPMADFEENFTDPANTVTTFLLALRDGDDERLARTLSPEADLAAIVVGGAADLPVVPRRLVTDGGDRAAQLGLLRSEPWRWSALRCRVWGWSGIGPVVRVADGHAQVLLQPRRRLSYRAVFSLHRNDDHQWHIARLAIDYQEPAPTDVLHPAILTDLVCEAPDEAQADAPALNGIAHVALMGSAADDPAVPVPTDSLVPPDRAVWQGTLPAVLQPALTESIYIRMRGDLLTRLADFRRIATGSPEGGPAIFRGAFVERQFQLVGATSVTCDLRVCLEGGDRGDTEPPRWSIRLRLQSVGQSWRVVDASADTEAWPPHAADRMATNGY